MPYEFIVATTSVLNGDQFVRSFFESVDNGLVGDDGSGEDVGSEGEEEAKPEAAPAPRKR